VRIHNRLSPERHLDEADLAAVWADASAIGNDPSHPHLAHCAQCRARMDAFIAWLEDVRSTGVSEADEAFPSERLAAQQTHIFRRIEAAERPARVIAFPTFSRPMSTGTSHVRRWITAAAAAGLIVGVAVGQLMDVRHNLLSGTVAELRRTEPRPSSERQSPRVELTAASDSDTDAAFMADIDASVRHNSLAELQALDAITPRAPFAESRSR
jgi:hypothetical protein